MIEIIKVVDVAWVGDYRLRIAFSNGRSGIHDFAAMVGETGSMVEPLADPAMFGAVSIEYGVLTWPNGFDIDSIALHHDMRDAGELSGQAV